MVNRNMMLDENFGDDQEELALAQEDTYAPEPDGQDEIIESMLQGELTLGNSPFWCDPFDCQFPNEPELDPDEEEELIRLLSEQGIETELSDDQDYAAELTISEDTQNRIYQIMENCRSVLKDISDLVPDVIESHPRRKYTNKATFEKAQFGQVEDADPPIWPKLMVAAGITLIIASYFGVMANSYFIAKEGKVNNAFECFYGWIQAQPPVSLSPLYADIFFVAFGIAAAICAAAILIIWDNSAQKKARREGKEHGNARFATMGDYKKYRQRHMDTKG